MKRAILAAIFLALVTAPASAQERLRLVEQEIKAGMIYNFLKYTQWPAGHGQGPSVVCLLGDNPLDGRLAPMAGRTVNQRVIEVRAVRGEGDLAPCEMVFVAASEKKNWPKVRTALAKADTLTVSDFDGFIDAGGMIEFTRADAHIGVAINLAAVSRAGLSVQDRLLRLADTSRGRSAP